MSPPGDADKVWCNDGGGLFVDSGQSVCTGSTYSVVLADPFSEGNDVVLNQPATGDGFTAYLPLVVK